jgi:hypothetical protein
MRAVKGEEGGRLKHSLESRRFAFKPDFDECMARVYAWYERRLVDRPLVRFLYSGEDYKRSRIVPGPWQSARERWLDADFQVRTWLQYLERTEFLAETFPVYWPDLSAVAYNLLLGQTPEFDDETAWLHPCVDDIDHLPSLAVQWHNAYFQAVEELTRRVLEHAERRFLVGFTDMYAGIDCTALLRGASEMCLDFVMNPGQIRHLIQTAFAEYPKVYERFDHALKAHGQLSVTWMNLPSYATFNVLACDFAWNVSPQHFDEFCMPILRQEAELFVHNVFHMDGAGVAKNIDSILTLPNLAAVQWDQGLEKDKPILQWVPLIQKIQHAGKSVIVTLELDELDAFMKRVDPIGMMLWIAAEPRDQRGVLDRIRRW